MSKWLYKYVEKDHYVILWVQDKKKLGQVVKKDTDYLQVVLEEGRPDPETRQELTIEPADVILNLGPEPVHGSVHGCKVEPWHQTVDSDFWGQIHFFRKLCKEDKAELKKGMHAAQKALKKHRLSAFLPLDVEVRPAQGKYSGRYKYRQKGTDTLTLNPKDFHPASVPHLVTHESAHGVWFRMVPQHLKAKWVQLYHAYTELTASTPQEIATLREELERSNMTVGQFKKASGMTDMLKECLDYVKRKHGLTVQHVDILLDSDESVAKYWPKTIQLFDIDIPVTDYSKESPEEFFAESLAMYLLGTKLPSRIEKAIRQTLQKVDRSNDPG